MRSLVSLLLMFALAGCIPHGEVQRQSHYQAPYVYAPHYSVPQSTESFSQCEHSLIRAQAAFLPLPDQHFAGSCSAIGAVQMSEIAPGIPITNTKALRCDVALPLARWFSDAVQSASQRWFGERVVKLESMGSYACRNIVGNAAYSSKLSEHAHANAVDIGGFMLADGQRVTVLNGWHGSDDEQGFLHEIHDAACRGFITVLSPDYNSAHANHLHFDMGGKAFCR